MRNFTIARIRWFFLLVLASVLSSCRSVTSTVDFNPERAFQHIQTQLAFGPRIPGTEAHDLAAKWIYGTLLNAQWHLETQSFEYLGTTITNIIATNACPGRVDQPFLILGAHYDTRPFADQDPDYPELPVPGANDGASGVAVLLEIAHLLPPCVLEEPLMLVFFDAEDSGGIEGWDWIVGSTYFAENLDQPTTGVIIVDMIGDQDLNLPLERNSDPALQNAIWEVAERGGFPAFQTTRGYAMIDDHTPFLIRGIPAVDIIDFDYPAWHTTSDTLDKVSEESLEQVGQVIINWLFERNSMNTEISPAN